MLNEVKLEGSLLRDFEVKGKVKRNVIVVDRPKGNIKDYIDITAISDSAKKQCEGLYHGDLVRVVGSWNVSKWNERTYHACIVKSIELLDKNVEEPKVEEEEPSVADTLGIDSDDLPF